jgi:hypothetical protein
MLLLDIDPNLVKPGWTPLIITIVLALAIALLYLSMRRQFAKINLPGDERPEAGQDAPVPPGAHD